MTPCMISDEKDMIFLGILSSCMRNGPNTECRKWRVEHDRKKPRSTYCLLSRIVCKGTFFFLLGYVNSLYLWWWLLSMLLLLLLFYSTSSWSCCFYNLLWTNLYHFHSINDFCIVHKPLLLLFYVIWFDNTNHK